MIFMLCRSLVTAVVAAAIALGTVAQAGVVFGNLGATGTNGLGGTNTDYGPFDTDEILIGQGFTTGTSSLLDLQSITVGLFFDSLDTSSITVSLYSSVSGTPGSVMFTSLPVSVGSTGKYDFAFSNAALSPSTTYWIVPSGPASFYTAPGSLFTPPAGQNGSGYAYVGTQVLSATSSVWQSAQIQSYAVSVVAVPEPPAIVLSGIGLATSMYLMRRRRG